MKSMLSVILVSFIVTGCSQHSKNISQQIKEMKEDIAEDANINNTKALKWEKVIDSLYKVADTNPNLAIYVIEHLRKDTSLEQHQRVTLHFIKGDVYYRMDSLFQAVREFSADLQAPK